MTEQQPPQAEQGRPPAPAAPPAPSMPSAPSSPFAPSGGPGGPGQGPQGGRPPMRKRRDFKGKYMPRRKVCTFCADKTARIDYKEAGRLRRFLSDRGKIEPRRKTGTCAKHQRKLGTALKRARFIALMPYTGEHIRQMGGPPPRERRD